MLSVFRRYSTGWVAKGFMVILGLSFGVWGIADVFRNFSTGAAAQIGDVKFSQEDFRRTYTDRLREMGRQIGRGITPDQARALGLDRQILSEMFSEAALDQKAHLFGLRIDDKTLAEKIEKSPEFAGPTGFNHEYFTLVLRSNGMSEGQYVDQQRKILLRQQISGALAGNVAIPKVMSDALRQYQTEERSIDYVTLGKSTAGAIPSPTPDQLKSFYDEHKAVFRAPEYRKLSILVLTPDVVAASTQISDDELKKIYDDHKNRFTTAEKREVEQIVFDKPEDAASASARLASGLSFDALATERKLSPKDITLGTVTKREILDPAVASAAFALSAGQVSAPVTGRFGTVLLRVKKIEPAIVQPFSAVAADLRKETVTERARREIFDLHDKIEDERASGASVPDIAKKMNLQFATFDAVDRSGRKSDGTKIEGIAGSPEVLGPAFNAPIGTDNDTIDLHNQGGYIWYDVNTITSSREQTFQEVEKRVEQRWKDEEIGKKLRALADDIRTKLDSGQSFAQAAPGMTIAHRDKLVRGKGVEGFDAANVNRIFATPLNKDGVLETADGVGRIVYRVTASSIPAAAAATTAKVEAGLSRGIQEDILGQFIQRTEKDLGVSVNEAMIRSATGADKQ